MVRESVPEGVKLKFQQMARTGEKLLKLRGTE